RADHRDGLTGGRLGDRAIVGPGIVHQLVVVEAQIWWIGIVRQPRIGRDIGKMRNGGFKARTHILPSLTRRTGYLFMPVIPVFYLPFYFPRKISTATGCSLSKEICNFGDMPSFLMSGRLDLCQAEFPH